MQRECGRFQQKVVAAKPRVLFPFDNLSSPSRFEGSSPIFLSYMFFFEQRSEIVSTISESSGSRSGRSGAATRGYLIFLTYPVVSDPSSCGARRFTRRQAIKERELD